MTSQTGGEAVVALPATTAASSNYGGFESVLYFDLRGQRVAVEVPQTTSTDTTAETDIQLLLPGGDTVSISEVSGMLETAQFIGGTTTPLSSMPFDAAAHRWWGFREDAGTLSFETSPDGVAFTAFHTMPAPALAQTAFILEGGTFESVTNGGAAHFDNVNGGTATGTFCPASTLRDDFSAGAIGSQWASSSTSGGCTYDESSGDFNVYMTMAAGQECSLRSAAAFDLTRDAAFTEVVAYPGMPQAYMGLRAAVLSGENVELVVVNTNLECAQIIGGNYTTSCSIPYDPVAHHFLRLHGTGGMLAYETSPDGMTWTARAQITPPIPLDAVQLSLIGGTNGAIGLPTSAAFGTFDVLPP